MQAVHRLGQAQHLLHLEAALQLLLIELLLPQLAPTSLRSGALSYSEHALEGVAQQHAAGGGAHADLLDPPLPAEGLQVESSGRGVADWTRS